MAKNLFEGCNNKSVTRNQAELVVDKILPAFLVRRKNFFFFSKWQPIASNKRFL